MKKLLVPIIVIVVILALAASMLIAPYNKLVDYSQEVDKQESNIDTQLQRRVDLIPNLVNTVKGYASHEKEVFQSVADARSKLAGAKTIEEKSSANQELSSALNRLIAISEAYPELKADAQFTGLRDELAGTENRIQVARKDYNDVVSEYNKVVKRFPGSIAASILGYKERAYFKADDNAKNAPKVDFNK
ncbi:LemA family protein [Macrococcus sp. DPC7161]|uniref:LemA family protein n=1 Tax=Macrococcus sp. DPC7161 TaxID=2507060 RepID=UPI00100A769B|nr:LemA family protein [Macrococcus sp. DPC7161]RXK18265.1 LemA family protein [Macrococcus sp. DPC7161]